MSTPRRPRTPLAPLQGTLALELTADVSDLPAAWPGPPEPAPAAGATAEVVPIDRRQRRELDAWALRFTQAAVEIAAAERPAQQLLRWTTAQVYRDLERRGRLAGRARVQRPAAFRAGGRPRVVGTRACPVSPTAVEVSAHVRHGGRSRAVALRFERRTDRWVCTALEFV